MVNEQSIMPTYPWLFRNDLDVNYTGRKVRIMQSLGVPYPDGYDKQAGADLLNQAQQISGGLKASGIEIEPNKEVIALIAYLQRLGTDISK
jgi:cytochrome c oxidase cbb3-type subunit I/II